jgi:hypothetical protein
MAVFCDRLVALVADGEEGGGGFDEVVLTGDAH